MPDLKSLEAWFVTGSQHLYGEETLRQVADHSRTIAAALSGSRDIPVTVVAQPVLTTPDAVRDVCAKANSSRNCIGLVAWMHTFSPAKMWLAGLRGLSKPMAHLHTQFNRELPWNSIDMDFMNLNQSAHGDREFGFLATRLGMNRKVIVGYWDDPEVHARLSTWCRAAAAWHDAQNLRIARFGDNMREVAVTEGDKVEAQARLGYSVSGFGVGDLACMVNQVSDAETDRLAGEYDDCYAVADALRPGGQRRQALRDAARIELGLRAFLEKGNFHAFTDTFENLRGLNQLPGIGVQRLMADGYGFGAEGDWKTAALVRSMKVMSQGLHGGTSFMEDYTYHFANSSSRVLGAHMLEVCPTIAAERPSLEIHPLAIGGKADPVRLVFTAPSGPGVVASIVQVGSRFRMIANEIDVVPPNQPLPKLPVARAVWKPRPDLSTAAAAWIYAGGAHHTGFSQALTIEHLQDFAEIADMEFLCIDQNTRLREFRNELRWNDAAYRFKGC
jgi:L-arabinose isomerase